MFLDHIPTCHGPSNMVLKPGAILSCIKCTHSINIYEYINNTNSPENPFQSSQLALEYAKWTGDINVPLSFPLVDIPGIVPKMVQTPLNVLRNGTRLLKLLTNPFLSKNNHEPITPLDQKILSNFLHEYIQTIESMEFPDTVEAKAVQALLGNMKRIFDTQVNFFQHYFQILVPYVRDYCDDLEAVDDDTKKSFEYDEINIEPSRAFYFESQKSNWVRQKYARFCIPLEVVHVMVYCYVCGRDSEAIANLCFHLGAKICESAGEKKIYSPSPFVSQKISSIIKHHVAYNKNTELYYLIREMERGNTCSILSMDILEKYGKLEKLLLNEFLHMMQSSSTSIDILKFAFSQNFPFILFAELHPEEYYGFITSLGYLATKIKSSGRNGTLEKGTFANARKIYKFVNTFAERVRKFETRSETFYWTMDTFKLLLCSDEILYREFNEMLQLLINEREQNPAAKV